MSKCPYCMEEFGDNEEKCPSCNSEGAKSPDEKDREPVENDERWAHLTTVSNEIDFELIAGLLEMGKIPVGHRIKGVDNIVGVPVEGIEVLVPESRLEEAVQLMDAKIEDENFEG